MIFLRCNRQYAFFLFYQGNSLIRYLGRPFFVFGTSDDLLCRLCLRQCIFMMQSQGCFQCQYSGHCFIQSLGSDNTLFNALQHEMIIFFEISCKQEHVASSCDRLRNRSLSAHRQHESCHGGGIGTDDTVESKPFS